MRRNVSIDKFSIRTLQAMRLANQNQSVTSTIMCHKMEDEKITEAVCSFPFLWQVTNKTYKDAWKVVGNQVIQVT